MPLNRPALTLGPGPQGVQAARRWVDDVCQAIGRDDLLECAELGVSELVTNAVLHGAAPIQVRVRGTAEHPRVEVRDASVDRPVLPGPRAMEPDDVLLTFGRGLALVARASDAWGADIEPDGKIVWFEPAPELSESGGAAGVITSSEVEEAPIARTEDLVDIAVYAVPLDLFLGFQRHFRELRREVRLLAVAHESSYPVAKSLSDLFGTLERQLHSGLSPHELEQAMRDGAESIDLHVTMPAAAAATLQRVLEMLDLADEFCRAQRLMSLARTPEQREFQQRLLQEYVRQARGGGPVVWSGPQRERVAH